MVQIALESRFDRDSAPGRRCANIYLVSEDRLTGLDASFLHMERAGAHMHVASTIVFEGDAPTHREFRDHIESRLHLVPRFRQKLRQVPFDQGRPVWVDDPHLNLDYHVRQTALPAPGSEEQLRNLGGADLLPAARPDQAALGAVAGRGPRRRPFRDRRQEPPRARRRRLRGRHHHRPLRPRARAGGPARAPAEVGPAAGAERPASARRRPARARHQPQGDRPRRPRRPARPAPGAARLPRHEQDDRRRHRRARRRPSTSRSAPTAGSPSCAAT